MMKVVKPPAPLQNVDFSKAVFLAGSIEMGVAEDWQAAIAQSLTHIGISPKEMSQLF